MVPVRTCIGCRQRFAQNEMIRIVLSADGNPTVDPEGKMPGRGAYVCRDLNCVEKMCSRGGLNRAFHTEVRPEALIRIKQTLTDIIVRREIG